MFASYQNSNTNSLKDKSGNQYNSIVNLDKIDSGNNLLSYFNFVSSTRYRKLKYYAIAAIVSLIFIIIFLSGGSNSTAAVSTPLLPPAANAIIASESSLCEDEDYFKKTLKEEYTAAFGGIIKNAENAEKYEASGVVYDSVRDVYWVVYDSLYALGKISSDMTRSDANVLVASNVNGINEGLNLEGYESGFEGITLDPDTDILYLLTESVQFRDNKDKKVYHSVIRSVTYDENETYTETQVCTVDYELASDNKGFESLNWVEIEGSKYFVGLCEGNYCESGSKGKESGHGRMVLINFEPVYLSSEYKSGKYQYLIDVGIDCMYEYMDKFKLPDYIDFIDYSAFQLQAQPGKEGYYNAVVVSQENSAIWVGELEWTDVENGPDFSVNKKDGNIYWFPKNDDCETIFCNVEGVAFSNNDNIVVVSDKAKGSGKQGFICGEKDQSIHIFQTK